MPGEWHMGQSSLSPAVPCLSPVCPLLVPVSTGHTQERSSLQTQDKRVPALQSWVPGGLEVPVQSEFLHSWGFDFLSWRTGWLMFSQQAAVSTFAVLVLLFPFIFLVALQTLTRRPNYPWISLSSLSLLCCSSSSDWDLTCRMLETPIKHRLLSLFNKLVEIDISTHSEQSLWASGPAFSSSVCGQKGEFKRWISLTSFAGPGAYQHWKFRSRAPVIPANLSNTQGTIPCEKSAKNGSKKRLKRDFWQGHRVLGQRGNGL